MAVNALIARGIAPIGGDVPQVANMLQQRKQQEMQNALAQQQMGIQQQNADAYSGQLKAATAARQAEATKEQYAYLANVGTALANAKTPEEFAMLADRVAASPQYQSIPDALPREQLTPEVIRATLPEIYARAQMQMPQAPVPFEQTPDALKIKMQGEQAMALERQRAASAAALERMRQGAPRAAPEPPKPQLVDVALPDGSVQKQWVAPGQPAGTPVGAPTQKPLPGEAKARREAAAKIPTIDATVRRVERLAAASEKLGNAIADGGPLDGMLLSKTPSGQELIQSAATLMPVLTSLTRVPGIGSQSDLEQRLAQLQLPDPSMYPDVRANAVKELRQFVLDLKQAALNVASGKVTATSPDAGGVPGDIDAILKKYK